jgi:predicted ATPase
MSLDDAAAACTAEPWNLLNVYIPKESLSLSATCELTLADELLSFSYELTLASEKGPRAQPRGRPFSVSSEILRLSGGKFADTVLLENRGGQVRLLHEKRFLRRLAPGSEPDYVDTIAPTDTTMLFRLYDLETNQRSNLFKRYLASWGYYNFDPTRLRNNQARAMETILEGSGSTLSSVLSTLHSARPRLEKKLIDAVKLLEPRLDLLSFQTPDPEHVYMFFEDRQGNKFGVNNISDGTLRYLAMCYLVLVGDDGVAERGGPPVTIVEEPENGIFVAHLKNLFEKIEPSGRQGQFVFTSHNPYFIDLFDASLQGLFFIKGGETHSTLIKPDPAKLQERLGKFSLGEMHFKGLLE